MNEVTRTQVVDCLRTVGVQPGDGVMVHAAIQFLGRPVGGVGIYWDAFREVLGPEGTLVVPTFNFGFCRGLTFDRESTPSEKMGVFAEHVRRLPVARRSPHPMQSVAAIGRYAGDLAARDTASAFDDGSAFDRMVDLDFKMILLGASIQTASMVHYCEQKHTVPYRYWKDFTGTVSRGGQRQQASYRMYARDLDLDPRIDQVPIQRALEVMGAWKETRLNYGTVAACRLRDFVAATTTLLSKDPWSLVGNLAEVQQRAQALPRGRADDRSG
jgi:aminoglycoside 3-N-acetyltransferase